MVIARCFLQTSKYNYCRPTSLLGTEKLIVKNVINGTINTERCVFNGIMAACTFIKEQKYKIHSNGKSLF